MKPIPGYDGIYSLTEGGEVFSHKRGSNNSKGGFLRPCVNRDGYLSVTLCKEGKKRSRPIHALMSITYLGQESGMMVDHKDRNRRNNHISNLRPCTDSQNGANSKRWSNNTSGYRGVCWDKAKQKWLSRLYVNGKTVHLSHHNDKMSAALAYDHVAKFHYGDFAFINFPEECQKALKA